MIRSEDHVDLRWYVVATATECLLADHEVAALVGRSVSWVRAAAKGERFPPQSQGPRWLKSEVVDWMQGRWRAPVRGAA